MSRCVLDEEAGRRRMNSGRLSQIRMTSVVPDWAVVVSRASNGDRNPNLLKKRCADETMTRRRPT